jgi:hypothetical protein
MSKQTVNAVVAVGAVAVIGAGIFYRTVVKGSADKAGEATARVTRKVISAFSFKKKVKPPTPTHTVRVKGKRVRTPAAVVVAPKQKPAVAVEVEVLPNTPAAETAIAAAFMKAEDLR